ncbi:FKBP-type peptidyl-prolyl cis-trans isomerase [Serratia marcescens]|nr:FKBP-type peptidyl-prolyl cis-trans isomerase [Serratia marcescens]
MITCYRLLVGLLLPLYGGGAFADDGIPALLQFAEKYQESRLPADAAPGSSPTGKAVSDSAPKSKLVQDRMSVRGSSEAKKPATAKPTTTPAIETQQKTLQAQAVQLKAQQSTIAQLEKQLAEAKQMPPSVRAPDAAAPDLQGVGLLAQRLRQALGFTPAEAQAIEQLRKLREREADSSAQLAGVIKDNARLQETLVDVKEMLVTRETTLAEKEQTLSAAQQELASLQKALQRREAEKGQAVTVQTAARQKQDTLTVELAALRTQLTEQEKVNKALNVQRDEVERARQALSVQLTAELQRGEQLQTDIVALRDRAKWLAAPQTLKTDTGRQAYAAGVSLGRDILDMLEERKGWGVTVERKTILAGIVDVFAGQYQLTTDVLALALAESEAAVNLARDKAGAAQQKLGEKFISTFKTKQGVALSASGFWYQINYVGDDPIVADAVVELVVKESLTDGTVIQDMDSTGNVLSQPLSAYPPLFREALGHLRNHGTLTMVVPPELAYGEAGYPPKIPPHATMVYELRVVDIKL